MKSPRRLKKRQVDDLSDKLESQKKKLKSSQTKTRRWKKKVGTLADVVS